MIKNKKREISQDRNCLLNRGRLVKGRKWGISEQSTLGGCVLLDGMYGNKKAGEYL